MASWHAQLDLHFRHDGTRTVLDQRHVGPLRVLRSLYPEAPAVCHGVIVHPPGGVAGGDVLALNVGVETGGHALLTTPGATRFYRSSGAPAQQTLTARIAAQARCEWLPLETLCHSGALVENRLVFELEAGAEMIGWDLLALGLPASGAPFDAGRVTQHIELPGAWLERAIVDATDRRLLDSPLGWAGQRVLATLWFAAGTPIAATRLQSLLDAAREIGEAHELAPQCGCTSPEPRVVVLRALAPRVEPARALLEAVWRAWRPLAWGLAPCAPRVWQT